jgi:hypothetical protein
MEHGTTTGDKKESFLKGPYTNDCFKLRVVDVIHSGKHAVFHQMAAQL